MRRAVQALIISGVLLSAAACGTANGATPGGVGTASPPVALTRTVDASTKSLCEALGQVYSKNMAPFAQALTEMVAARQRTGAGQDYQRQGQQSLKAFATAIRTATQSNTDAQLRTDGKKAADQLQAKAGDVGFFSAIKTSEDVQKVLGPTLTEWLSPIAHHCS